MQKNLILALFVISLFFQIVLPGTITADLRDMVWQVADQGIRSTDMRIVSADPVNADTVYASSMNTVYKTSDSGDTWKEIVSFMGTERMIYALAVGNENTEALYIGTGDGLFRTGGTDMRLEKIYSSVGKQEGKVLSIASNNEDYLYIGTGDGIFFTKNRGRTWEMGRNIPNDTGVYHIGRDGDDPQIMY